MSELKKLRAALPGVQCEEFCGDNLAVFLASEFEPGVESDELDDSGTWKQEAIDKTNAVLDAIHAHYAAAWNRRHLDNDAFNAGVRAAAERYAEASEWDYFGSANAAILTLIKTGEGE